MKVDFVSPFLPDKESQSQLACLAGGSTTGNWDPLSPKVLATEWLDIDPLFRVPQYYLCPRPMFPTMTSGRQLCLGRKTSGRQNRNKRNCLYSPKPWFLRKASIQK